MDITRYWAIVRERWIVFVVGLVVTVVVIGVLVNRQPDVYESSGTFVVRPRTAEDTVRAIDTLNRSVEIGATYAYIARSDLIEERAKERLDGDSRGLRVGADVIAGTNVIEISVTGGDPTQVTALATAVGEETVSYVGALQDAFELAPLEAPRAPSSPSGPNRRLTMGLGAVFGFAVGAVLALGAHLAGEWRRSAPRSDIIDPYTGVYSESYFRDRFRQEALRARRRRRPFSLGLLKLVVDHTTHQAPPTQGILRQVAMMLQGRISEGDVLAYLGDGVFSVIALTQDVYRTEWQVKQWQKEIETLEFGDRELPVVVRVSVGAGNFGFSVDVPDDPDDAVSGLI